MKTWTQENLIRILILKLPFFNMKNLKLYLLLFFTSLSFICFTQNFEAKCDVEITRIDTIKRADSSWVINYFAVEPKIIVRTEHFNKKNIMTAIEGHYIKINYHYFVGFNSLGKMEYFSYSVAGKKIIKRFYSNGNLKCIEEYKTPKKRGIKPTRNGHFQHFNNDGILEKIEIFKNGKMKNCINCEK